MASALKLLIVEDSEDDALLLVRQVRKGGFDPTVLRVDSLKAMAEALEGESWDVVVSDYRLPGFTARSVLRLMEQSGKDIPFIVVSGAIGEVRLVSLMKAGAHDVIMKNSLARLVPAIRREMDHAASRHTRRAAQNRLEYLARYDSLSGLPNRTLFQDRLTQALLRAKRSKKSMALMYLDIDRFKSINDRLGHAAGDELLRAVAQRLSRAIRASDTAARLGGDEFAILIEGLEGRGAVEEVVGKLSQTFTAPFQLDGNNINVTSSIGIAIYPECGEDAQSLVNNADTAMYYAKGQGRNMFKIYDPTLSADAKRRDQNIAPLRERLEQEYYLLDGATINDFNNMLVPILNLTKVPPGPAMQLQDGIQLNKLFLAGCRISNLIKQISDGSTGEALRPAKLVDASAVY